MDDPVYADFTRLSARVAETLDKARIPNVLIGTTALILYGAQPLEANLDFLVADDQINLAVSALVSAGYSACTDQACTADEDYRGIAAPGHVHFREFPGECVLLHKHSVIAWRVPSLDPSEIGPEHDIMSASNDCLPNPWPSGLYPVRLLSVHRFLEVAILKILQATGGEQWPDEHQEDLAYSWEREESLIMDDRYNVWKYQLHKELLPPSHRRYVKWTEKRDFGSKKPKMSSTKAMAILFRDSAREEAEFQASKGRREAEGLDGPRDG